MRSPYGGEAVGDVVEFDNGFTLSHAGDTNVFGDMAMTPGDTLSYASGA